MRLFAVILALLAAAPQTGHAGDGPIRLLVLGDSLTAGYGLPASRAFPVRLQAELKRRGRNVKVINAGVSGDTTAGGLARLAWSLADKPDFAIIELGANDALRGIDPDSTFRNLDRIIVRLTQAGIKILITGMYAPPNWGREYTKRFNAIYPKLAKKYNVMLYPFFLDGVATLPKLNQRDGIHPNAAGVEEIVDRITPYVLRLLHNHPRGS